VSQIQRRRRTVADKPKVPRWLYSPDSAFSDPYFAYDLFEQGFETGHESAFWDAVLFCELTGIRKPEWVHDALVQYAWDRIRGLPLKKKKKKEVNQLSRDIGIFVIVNEARMKTGKFGRKSAARKVGKQGAYVAPGPKARLRQMSLSRGRQIAQKLLAEDGHNLSIGAIRAAYERAERKLSTHGFYGSSPFLEIPAMESLNLAKKRP
jgi:hypothetical protein